MRYQLSRTQVYILSISSETFLKLTENGFDRLARKILTAKCGILPVEYGEAFMVSDLTVLI